MSTGIFQAAIVLLCVVASIPAYPSALWMRKVRRSPVNVPRRAPAMPPPIPAQFYLPSRALSFSGYFAGSGYPYGANWAGARNELPSFYLNEDGSMQLATIVRGDRHDYHRTHSYDLTAPNVHLNMDTYIPPSRSDRAPLRPPAPPPADENSNTIPGAGVNLGIPGVTSGEGLLPETPPDLSDTTTTLPPTTTIADASLQPLQPISPAASEPSGASATPEEPSPRNSWNGGRSHRTNNPQPQPPQDDDDNYQSGYGNPTINAWFPFVFGATGSNSPARRYGGNGSASGDAGYTGEGANNAHPDSERPQSGSSGNIPGRGSGANPGHSPIAIANSFSTGRNAMAHSVATAYGLPQTNQRPRDT